MPVTRQGNFGSRATTSIDFALGGLSRRDCESLEPLPEASPLLQGAKIYLGISRMLDCTSNPANFVHKL
ncbi:MAG: hypothetical protein DME45_00090 [Verrucomicrobia bacterium]|nr:MAG: hypothetical protein DME45_00090 [Verrucomicrobiota bacterium]